MSAIPLARRGYPAGTSSLVTMVCSGQMGMGRPGSSRPLPGTTAHRHAGNKLIPTSYCDVKAQPLFKDGCQL